MRWILLLIALLLLQSVAAHHDVVPQRQLLLRIDMLRPVFYNADSFATAQRMAYRDYEAFLKQPNNETYTRVNDSLERLGAIAGYTDPWVCRSTIRSVVTYRTLRQNVDQTSMKQYETYYCRARVKR